VTLLRRCWRMVAEPTLVRRLMWAQILLLLLLWSVVVAVIVRNGGDSSWYLNSLKTYEAMISVADSLAAQPGQQQRNLGLMDAALREEFDRGNIAELGPLVLVWQGGRLVYRTHGAPADLRGDDTVAMETVYIRGKRWRARTIRSPHTDTRVMIAAPVDRLDVFLTINSRGYFLLPLLISLPLLPLPAWLSVTLALRPWSRVAQEVAARGPHDLTPLTVRPRHRELAAMVDSINALMRRVHQSALRERSFIADAAHELRTPLAAMCVNAEALQGQAHGPVQRELLNGILNSGNRAGRLVGQLLQLMRSDATTGEPHAVIPFDALVQDRLATLSGLASMAQVELELVNAEPVCIRGQRDSLESLVDNLVDNAIKYSPRRGIVKVALAGKDGWARLTIEDDGPGIAPELRERVFDRFFRASQQSQSGSGLGLAIAASVTARHDGQIRLEDAPGGGLRVVVTLPLA
jgi:two-component system, OmpR family, sensor histidine kinase QseC